ncbi:MAG: hypothetical protein ABIA93_05615 [Candidatus Woesearchaeota archaeon]
MAITLRYVNLKKADGTPRRAPFISVKTRSGEGRPVEVDALVDSGSDSPVIPFELAEVARLNLNGEKAMTRGIGGSIPVIASSISIEVEGGHERPTLQLPVLVVTDKALKIPFILGRNGFFEHFHITFRQNEQRLTLTRTESRQNILK